MTLSDGRRHGSIPILRFAAVLILCGATTLHAQPASQKPPPAQPPTSASPTEWSLPALELDDVDGIPRRLKDLQGQVILLNFWATWCPPCQFEIPRLMEYQRYYAPAGLRVISVGLDERRKLANFVRTVGINYPVLVADPQRDLKLLTAWGDGPQVLPYTVVIDREGHVVHRQQGIFEDVTFEDFVLPLMNGKGADRDR